VDEGPSLPKEYRQPERAASEQGQQQGRVVELSESGIDELAARIRRTAKARGLTEREAMLEAWGACGYENNEYSHATWQAVGGRLGMKVV
jgi:hypothetical protein